MARWLAGLAVFFVCWGARARDEPREWCAPEITELVSGTCHFAPTAAGEAEARTLVIFLHGVIEPNSNWQHAQQRAMVRAARRYGFDVLMPRGRRGVGPRGMEDWWTWPTSVKQQERVEHEILHEWGAARWLLEQTTGVRFARLLVFGFSNGAYYASQLALRGAYTADGFALFAGGSGARWLARRALAVRHRPPVFIGFGSRDVEARNDGRRLANALRQLGWRHLAREQPQGSHTISDELMERAARYFELNPPDSAGPT